MYAYVEQIKVNGTHEKSIEIIINISTVLSFQIT